MALPSSQPPLWGAGTVTQDPALEGFHPVVATWFASRFAGGPTAPQRQAWPVIAAGGDVLVASPTGTGKTLTGFMVAIDACFQAHAQGAFIPGRPRVLYVSPLKALAADVRENLLQPLAEIEATAAAMVVPSPVINVGIRTGDSTPAERAALVKRPPELIVTTPESLYLLVTSAKGRQALASIETVIIDEIHTLARDKRGVHLALSLERLSALVGSEGRRLQRIGLSATQRPLEDVARLLSGVGEGRVLPAIIDCGHVRGLDLEIELPSTELEAVGSATQFAEVLDQIAAHVTEHRTTLIFVNTRRMAERVAHQLAERLGEDPDDPDPAGLRVAAHHGSLSTARRRLVEARLRAGDLKALVATASLELGIDVGPVELVCQIGSPRSIATFLQRVGRANHHVEGTPAGRLYPLNRDELVECTALLAAVAAGDLDQIVFPKPALDIVIQQVVAEVAAREEVGLEELYTLVRHAAPFEHLEREDFDEILELAGRGILTGRGRRGAHLHLDTVDGVARPRKGARLTALLNGGAIPETGDYKVVLDPEGVTLGTIHEDFAIESAPGDVFLLGTHPWRVRKVETGVVRVVDAEGAPPSVPFWLGEAPARTAELSHWVGVLRSEAEAALRAHEANALPKRICDLAKVSRVVGEQVATYLAACYAALGQLPTEHHLVVERFFDEAEGSQLVVHSPHGGRINRALGLALRKRFCVTFDFELQAAANDDAIVISLGPHHSFPLSQVPKMVRSDQAVAVLTQAVLPHPMLQARWRWNLNRALVVARTSSGGRRPIHLQRMESEDLLAATWPSLAACQENAPPGPIPIPDHLLVRQAITDVLSEPMDADGLVALLEGIESGAVTVSFVESATPSPLAHGILTAQPYTFLDDAPLEERRTRAVPLQRGLPELSDVVAGGSAVLDPVALAELLEVVAPKVRSADELHDLCCDLVVVRPVEAWQGFADQLRSAGRLQLLEGNWVPNETLERARALGEDDDAAAECLRGHLEVAGPVRLGQLIDAGPLGAGPLLGAPLTELRAATAIRRLEAQGFAIELTDGRWCARHLLVRLHQRSAGRRRQSIDAVPIATYLDLLAELHHVAPGTQVHGPEGLLAVLEQLQGLELPAGDWEEHILRARVADYDPRWLDELCLAGVVTWVRLTPKAPQARSGRPRGSQSPSSATPLALVVRDDLGLWLDAVRQGVDPEVPSTGAAADLYEVLSSRGAMFRGELTEAAGRLPAEIDEGLWELVARGVVHADAFGAVRSLLSARSRWATRQRQGRSPLVTRSGRRPSRSSAPGEGRWSLLPSSARHFGPGVIDREDLATEVAIQLLERWGVVVFELWSREAFAMPWREVSRALRRLEARGQIAGGRFIAGISGEQFARHDVVEALASRTPAASPITVCAADPLNLTGIIVPGPRVPAVRHRQVTLHRGQLVEGAIA